MTEREVYFVKEKLGRPLACPPPTHNQEPYDTRHYQSCVTKERFREIPQSPPVTKAECLHQPGCSPPLHATDHLGLVGARTARHDREPGGPQSIYPLPGSRFVHPRFREKDDGLYPSRISLRGLRRGGRGGLHGRAIVRRRRHLSAQPQPEPRPREAGSLDVESREEATLLPAARDGHAVLYGAHVGRYRLVSLTLALTLTLTLTLT